MGSVLSTLVYRAQVVSGPEFLQEELNLPCKIFVYNDYRLKEANWALSNRPNKIPAEDYDTDKPVAVLPFYGSVSTKIGRLLVKLQFACHQN